MKRKRTGLEGQTATRAATLSDASVDRDARTIELSLVSETPVARWHWDIGEFDEVLLCGSENVDLSRMTPEAAAPFLFDHDMRSRAQIGVIESARLEKRVLRVTARIQNSPEGTQLLTDVADRIKRNVSAGYFVRDIEIHEKEGERPLVVVTRWQPFEGSSVAAGADPTVGVGRSTAGQYPDELIRALRRKAMKPKIGAADPAADDSPAPSKSEVRVNVSEARAEARAAETARIREIQAIGRVHGLSKEADVAVEKGTELEDFRSLALDTLQARQQTAKPTVDVPRTEHRRYSLGRAVQALMLGRPELAPLELEVSRAYEDAGAKLLRPGKSIIVPMRYLRPSGSDRSLAAQVREALGMRAIITKAGEGADLVGTDHLGEEYVPHLLSDLVLAKAGARILPGLIGDVDIPAGDGGYGNATWAGSETANAGEIAPLMRSIAASPKTASGYTDFTRRMRLQGVPALEAIVRTGITDSLNELLERTALNGTASSTVPGGLYNVSGIGSVTFGGAPTYAKFWDMYGAVKAAKGTGQRFGYVTSFGVAVKAVTTTRGGTGSDRMIAEMTSDGVFRIDGFPLHPTQESPQTFGSPADDHGVAFGDWSKMVFCQWGDGIEISVETSALHLSGGIRVVGFLDVDVIVTLNKSFAKAIDVAV
jgi:HK97 family phage major capsid protein